MNKTIRPAVFRTVLLLHGIDRFPDIMAHVLTVETDPLAGFVRVCPCFFERTAESCDTEHTSSAGDGLSVFAELRSGVEAVIAFRVIELLKSRDDFALLIASGITA